VGIREKHVLREAAKEVLIPEVYDRQKHAFTTLPTRNENDPMLALATNMTEDLSKSSIERCGSTREPG